MLLTLWNCTPWLAGWPWCDVGGTQHTSVCCHLYLKEESLFAEPQVQELSPQRATEPRQKSATEEEPSHGWQWGGAAMTVGPSMKVGFPEPWGPHLPGKAAGA